LILIQDYDRCNSMPPDSSTSAERLEFLMDHSEKTPDDLVPIFGQLRHVQEALTGERAISADQARMLGVLFSVESRLFI
jgi:hypothetical protein